MLLSRRVAISCIPSTARAPGVDEQHGLEARGAYGRARFLRCFHDPEARVVYGRARFLHGFHDQFSVDLSSHQT
jgi:hypothetical protein